MPYMHANDLYRFAEQKVMQSNISFKLSYARIFLLSYFDVFSGRISLQDCFDIFEICVFRKQALIENIRVANLSLPGYVSTW